LDRLAGDTDLYRAIKASNFVGEDWEFVAGEMARYGIAVFEAWMASGVITERCLEKKVKGVPSLPEAVRRDRHLCADIVAETVASALLKFRDEVLKKDIWDPAKGASLRTFFIRQCMWRYGEAFRRMTSSRAHELRTDDAEILDTSAVTLVEDDVIRMQTADLLLKGATNERAARAFAMHVSGYNNKAIAVDLGVSVDSVKSLLKRERQNLSARLNREDIA
jgi:DNA-directed RNA polymerase specialized sigma24 family protein